MLERKVDHQNEEMGSLKTKHEELKTLFKTLKSSTETFMMDRHNNLKDADVPDVAKMEKKDLNKPNTNDYSRIKRPYRLLPVSSIQKYESSYMNKFS